MTPFKLIVFIQLIALAFAFYDESSAFEIDPAWESVRSNIDTSFSCEGRSYNYYADVANDCQLYHVCNPREENGQTVYSHSTFICPAETVFDQQLLTCVKSTPEFNCADQVRFYDSNTMVHTPVVSNEVRSEVVAPVREVNNESSEVANEPVVNSSPVNDASPRETVSESTPLRSSSEEPEVAQKAVKGGQQQQQQIETPVKESTKSPSKTQKQEQTPIKEQPSKSQQQEQTPIKQQEEQPAKGPKKGGQQQQEQTPIKQQEEQPAKGPKKGGQQQQTTQQVEQPSKSPTKGGQQQQTTQQIEQPSKSPTKSIKSSQVSARNVHVPYHRINHI